MAQTEAAKALANILNKVARYSILLGIGGSAIQASLYTGKSPTLFSTPCTYLLTLLHFLHPQSMVVSVPSCMIVFRVF